MKSVLRKRIMDKYSLYDGMILETYKIKKIVRIENILINEIAFLLGLYKGVLYNENTKYSRINLSKNISIKDNIKLILLDLKYLKRYGQRSYTKNEIIKLCKMYDVEINDFLKYSKRNISCFSDNLEIIQKNDLGLWIGPNPMVTRTFLIKNNDLIDKGLKKMCYIIMKKYNCYNQKDDLYLAGKEAILKNGQLEKNFRFDKERMFNKFFFRAKWAMVDYIIQNYKYILSENEFDKKVDISYYIYDVEEELKFNLLKNISFNMLEQIVIEELINNLDESLENRKKVFNMIIKKLDINLKKLNEIIYSIQLKIVNSGNVRLCNNERVILKSE